jgi:hypothetical protein
MEGAEFWNEYGIEGDDRDVDMDENDDDN